MWTLHLTRTLWMTATTGAATKPHSEEAERERQSKVQILQSRGWSGQQEQETLQALQSQLADLQKVKAACAANAPNKDALFDVEVNGTSRSFAALQVLNRKTLHFLFSCGGAKAPPPTPAGNPYGGPTPYYGVRGEQPAQTASEACTLEHLQRLEAAGRAVLSLPAYLGRGGSRCAPRGRGQQTQQLSPVARSGRRALATTSGAPAIQSGS